MIDAIVVVIGFFAAFAIIGGGALYLQRRVQTKAARALLTASQANQGAALSQLQLMSIQARLKLEGQFKNGAGWFYWISGLSILNTLLSLTGSKWSLMFGLEVTQLVDGLTMILARQVGPNLGLVIQVAGFVVDLSLAGVFIVCGIFAHKKRSWAFSLGMTLYALDGLIFLPFGGWLFAAFHAFCLYALYSGLKAKQKLDALDRVQPVALAA